MNPVGSYRIDTQDPLTREEEVALFRALRATTVEAERARLIERVIQHNARYVLVAVRPYLGPGITMDELYSAGMCGLLEAVERFDPERGYKFISYAVWWMREFARREVRALKGPVAYPQNRSSYDQDCQKMRARLEGKLCRSVSAAEVEDAMLEEGLGRENDLGFPSPTFIYLDDEGGYHEPTKNRINLDPFTENPSPSPLEEAEQSDLRGAVQEALQEVMPRERQALEGVFWGGQTLREVGREHGYSRERARQLRNNGLERLSTVRGLRAEEYLRP